MKLSNYSIFDRAVIVALVDNDLYYEYATHLPVIDILQFNDFGINIYKDTGFDNKCIFWVENDDAYPFIVNNNKYVIIDSDDEYEFLKENKIISDYWRDIIENGFDIINKIVAKGGLLCNNGI